VTCFIMKCYLNLRLSNKRKAIYNMCFLNSRYYDKLFRHHGNLSPRICHPCHNLGNIGSWHWMSVAMTTNMAISMHAAPHQAGHYPYKHKWLPQTSYNLMTGKIFSMCNYGPVQHKNIRIFYFSFELVLFW